MSKLNCFSVACAITFANPVIAEPPKVVTDIAPVQSLVAMVMGDFRAPDVILRPGETPHTATLRPSQARALQAADIVFWVGEDLSPWLSEPIETLAVDAKSVELLHISGTTVLDNREAGDDHDDHHHGHHDPHGWLDPENAKVWLDHIATTLGNLDAENVARYKVNAAKGKHAIKKAVTKIEMDLALAQSKKYMIYHDALQYFEQSFDLTFVAAVVPSDDQPASAARVSAVVQQMNDHDIACVFLDRAAQTKFVETLIDDHNIGHATLNILTAQPTDTNSGYVKMLFDLAQAIANCDKS